MPARALVRATIGRKIIMAATGIVGILFLILHVLGNLQIFAGAAKLNGYSAMLHGPLHEALVAVRVVLVVAVVLHVWMAVDLTLRNRAARPIAYRRRVPQVSTWAARTMRWGGLVLLIFIPLHILHFTTGSIRPGGHFVTGDVYGNVVAGFRIWWVTAFYLVAMVALGYHLYHGAWASWRTIGAAEARPDPLRRPVGWILAIGIAAGFALVPVAVFAGWVR